MYRRGGLMLYNNVLIRRFRLAFCYNNARRPVHRGKTQETQQVFRKCPCYVPPPAAPRVPPPCPALTIYHVKQVHHIVTNTPSVLCRAGGNRQWGRTVVISVCRCHLSLRCNSFYIYIYILKFNTSPAIIIIYDRVSITVRTVQFFF